MVISIIGLEISVPVLIWTVIDFFILMFVLKKFLFDPILDVMDKRNEKISNSLKRGKEAKEELVRTRERLGNEIAAENAKADRILLDARARDEVERGRIMDDTRKKVKEIREGSKDILKEKEADVRSEVEKEMPEMVDLLTKTLLS